MFERGPVGAEPGADFCAIRRSRARTSLPSPARWRPTAPGHRSRRPQPLARANRRGARRLSPPLVRKLRRPGPPAGTRTEFLMDQKPGQKGRARYSDCALTRRCCRSNNLSEKELRSLELFRELATFTGVAQRPLPAALSGSLNKAPGFAGDTYLLPCGLIDASAVSKNKMLPCRWDAPGASSFGGEKPGASLVENRAGQPARHEGAGVDIDAVGQHLGGFGRSVAMHHDFAEVRPAGKKLLTDP
jgi:hypothetical protein